MIAYFDASALVKRHVDERGSHETLAWEYGLRGYDAVQLASAALFQESLGTAVRLATFDKPLWNAAKRAGFEPWPEKAP